MACQKYAFCVMKVVESVYFCYIAARAERVEIIRHIRISLVSGHMQGSDTKLVIGAQLIQQL
jgi:hypothetical protein